MPKTRYKRQQQGRDDEEEGSLSRINVPFAMITAILVCSMAYSMTRSQRQLKDLLDVGYKTAVNITNNLATSTGSDVMNGNWSWSAAISGTMSLSVSSSSTSTTSRSGIGSTGDPEMDFYNEQVTKQIADPEWTQAWNHCVHLWKVHNDTYNTFRVAPELARVGLKQPAPYQQLPMLTTPGIDTSVIITSNLIPSHPSISMTNETIYSLHKHLIGLPKETPIYVSVDIPPPKKFQAQDNQKRLLEYVERLKATNYSQIFTNVHVVLLKRHSYLAGSVYHTLTRNVQTPFFYLVQHDMPFARGIDHTRLVEAMKAHPTILNNIRFRFNNGPNTQKTCKTYQKYVQTMSTNDTTVTTRFINLTDDPTASFQADNGLDFYISDFFSDNNQISTKWYYLEMMKQFQSHYFAMELYMMTAAREYCHLFGQQLYGKRDDYAPYLAHLDGRKTIPGA